MRLSTALPTLTALTALTAVLALLLPLAGCGHIKPIGFTGPNGRPAYLYACSGAFKSMESCRKDAAQACPGGFDVIDNPTNVPGLAHVQGGMLVKSDETLTVECKPDVAKDAAKPEVKA